MAQADFAYGSQLASAAELPRGSVAIYADRLHIRHAIRDDALAAGLTVAATGNLLDCLEPGYVPAGETVLVDCPVVDGAVCAALSTLDMAVAQRGTRLVVSTGVEALDSVFACLDQSSPEILVEPTRAERLMALGRALAHASPSRVRELSEQDRMSLLRLTEQVGAIAARLDGLQDDTGGLFRLHSSPRDYKGEGASPSDRLVRKPRPPLPDPRLVRTIIERRQARARFFDGDLFADPAWDMLLDLTAARAEHKRVSVTSLCIASGVPPTTALRWIAQMTDAGLLVRVEDETDRRRAFIALSDKAADAMARYFAEIGTGAGRLA